MINKLKTKQIKKTFSRTQFIAVHVDANCWC